MKTAFSLVSHIKSPHEPSQNIADFKAASQLACALRCNAKIDCLEAIYYRVSKKCSLYQKKEFKEGLLDFQAVGDNKRSSIVKMLKVSNLIPNNYLVCAIGYMYYT